MASTYTSNTVPSIDAVFEQVKERSEQFVSTARKAGNAYLDAYDKAVDSTLELQLKVAGMTQQQWLTDLVKTQAEFAREVTDSYTSTARSLIA